MKYKLFALMLASVAMLFFCGIQAHALSDQHIIDDAGLLSEQERAYLEQEAQRVSETFQVGVYVYTVPDVDESDYLFDVGEELYLNGTVGHPVSNSAVLLIIDPQGYYYDFLYNTFYTFEYAIEETEYAYYNYASSGEDYNSFIEQFILSAEESMYQEYEAYEQSMAAIESLEIANVMDAADILSTEEESMLTEKAARLSAEHEVEFYIMTVGDYNLIAENTYIEDTMTQFYADNGLGYGQEKDGVMLVLSMDDRDYTYFRYGDKAHSLIAESLMDSVEAEFLSHFGEDDWYGGFDAYLEETEYQIKYGWLGPLLSFTPFLLLGFVMATVMANSFRKKLKSVQKQTAQAYISHGETNIHIQEDVYTHTTTTRTRISKSGSGGSGGGGGRSFSGGGFSGRSGKF